MPGFQVVCVLCVWSQLLQMEFKLSVMKILVKRTVENTRYFFAILALQPELAPLSSCCVKPKTSYSWQKTCIFPKNSTFILFYHNLMIKEWEVHALSARQQHRLGQAFQLLLQGLELSVAQGARVLGRLSTALCVCGDIHPTGGKWALQPLLEFLFFLMYWYNAALNVKFTSLRPSLAGELGVIYTLPPGQRTESVRLLLSKCINHLKYSQLLTISPPQKKTQQTYLQINFRYAEGQMSVMQWILKSGGLW